MSIALTLERYLDAKSVKYDVIAHDLEELSKWPP